MSDERPRRRDRKEILLNIGIGFLLLCLLVSVDSSLLRRFERSGIDWLIKMRVGTAGHTQKGVQYVYLDIDEVTYRLWGEPWFTPRDKLLQLIRFAEQGGARIVIVDIDLSQQLDEADTALREHFETYARRGREVPDLLVSASMRYPALPEDPEWPVHRESFLDDSIAASSRLHWASPIFIKDSDQVIRRWQLLARVADSDGVLPSHQFLSVALLVDPDRQASILAEISTRYDERSQGRASSSIALGDLEIDLREESIPQRINYAIPWRGPGQVGSSAVRSTAGVTVIPAHRITDTTRELDASALEGKVVVIGSSYRESGDLHMTPLGIMPGSFIIVNAIHSLLSVGQISPPAWWLRILLGMLPLIVMSVALVKVRLRLVKKLMIWILIIPLVPVSFAFFHYGVWMDFFIPMIIVDILSKVRAAREVRKIVQQARSSRGERSGPQSASSQAPGGSRDA